MLRRLLKGWVCRVSHWPLQSAKQVKRPGFTGEGHIMRPLEAKPPIVDGQEADSGSWQGLVIICAGTAWDRGGCPAEKHIATRLTRWAPVLYVDPPSSPISRLRDGGRSRVGLRV